MKVIIDRKRYDTEKAEKVASRFYGEISDFYHVHETLYRTPRGNWFLAGSGGPGTRYAASSGQNEWSGSQKIEPFSDVEARGWLEVNGEVRALEKYFGDSIEDA
jgi:hypothetical protein